MSLGISALSASASAASGDQRTAKDADRLSGQALSGPAVRLDRLQTWFELNLGLIRQNEQNALRAGRSLSYVAAGLQSAWGSAESAPEFKHGPAAALRASCAERAAHAGALALLMHFYPRANHVQLSAHAARLNLAIHELAGKALPAKLTAWADTAGHRVAQGLIRRSLLDGADARWTPALRPAAFEGIWQPTYPMFAVVPLEGMAPSWQPWARVGAGRYVPPQAVRPGSEAHAAQTREVWQVAASLSAEHKASAEWWNLDAGSVTPAGVWMKLAMALVNGPGTLALPPGGSSAQGGGADIDTARVADGEFARTVRGLCLYRELTAAMHDANIACWAIKLRDWSERPVTAIRRDLDTKFVPVVTTPGHPSYVSGHATLSAAAAAVLAHHLPQHRSSLMQRAQEAAESRLWGGIHFRDDNEEGLKLGDSVAADVLGGLG
jgi:hypothetical protein